ncbi:MAG: DUF3786 domain-containing protein [Dehalococcoidia bacterium]|nr:DUF3786 domain-containing protein [Dehalococcoidia bacterium]RLC65069.1 MAG: hypothetical protein DRI01_02050 [Chloroflexota bacterium]
MKNQHSSSHGSREQGFELSYNLAREQLSKISDVEEQCCKSGAMYVGTNKIIIDYLNKPYHITFPDVEISLGDSKVEVPLKDKTLILHYFTMAKGTPPTDILITYKQLPGGMDYFPAFFQRTINPLVKHFGRNPELLISKAVKLGGDKADYGDASVIINAFSHVPITLVLWRGDEEVAPNGNILFDANISDYLSTEDVTVLCEAIIWKLIKDISSA